MELFDAAKTRHRLRKACDHGILTFDEKRGNEVYDKIDAIKSEEDRVAFIDWLETEWPKNLIPDREWDKFVAAMNSAKWEDAKRLGDWLLQHFRKGGIVPDNMIAATGGLANPYGLAAKLKDGLFLLYWITGTADQIS